MFRPKVVRRCLAGSRALKFCVRGAPAWDPVGERRGLPGWTLALFATPALSPESSRRSVSLPELSNGSVAAGSSLHKNTCTLLSIRAEEVLCAEIVHF